MDKKNGIVWFRQDLRLHDNEALTEALKYCENVIPVFIFDDRVFKGTTAYGFPKTGKFRTKFIIESVEDLRNSLQRIGSNLIIRCGKPEDEIYQIARKYRTSWVFCNRERTHEEVLVQDALERKLWAIGQEVRFSRGKMLFYTADFPFPITHTPDVFTSFRKEVERFIPIRTPLVAPTEMPALPEDLQVGSLPTLAEFGQEDFEVDSRSVLNFKGGETAGLERLKYYFGERDLPKTYKDTRNELLGGDYSTKFSPWLAQGCLSPKLIYQELKNYEARRVKNKSTYWIFFELMWRDFFRLMGKKHGNKIFLKSGTREKIRQDLTDDRQLLQIWIDGRTGIPFVDANMRELKNTGFMSNRGRQNVASFLINDLHVNWKMGAAYFESILLDYDPCSNYGNWNYLAGVGSDPREDRYFNILSQARRYDPKGEYVKHWIPELNDLPQDKIHTPDQLSSKEQLKLSVKIGADYPKAMVSWE